MGMAVDANVLIFERMREELYSGRGPVTAVDAGYRRAMVTIWDSNLTTLIAGVLLFHFGTGPIKGFAVTLSLGLITSMFSALMVPRVIVVFWLRCRRPQPLAIQERQAMRSEVHSIALQSPMRLSFAFHRLTKHTIQQ